MFRVVRCTPWLPLLLGSILSSICDIEAIAQESTWESLISKIDVPSDTVAGQWAKASKQLDVSASEGARLMLPITPAAEYDLRVSFTRRTGEHSVGVVLVHGDQQVCFEVDAWGRHLAGFQDVHGKTIQDNATRKEGVSLVNGQRYVMLLEVRKDRIRGWLDDQEIASLSMDNAQVSIHPLWNIPRKDRLALLAWNSSTRFHSVEYRVHSGSSNSVAQSSSMKDERHTNRSVDGTASSSSTKSNSKPGDNGQRVASKDSATVRKKVLLVIANYHFFYREYNEPRQELERAGIQVTVAAGRRGICRPHNGSGEGADGGEVRAEVALSEVKADDYDALLFSGGWGASMYQFAFNGRYDEPAYNGERAVKVQANRLINEFLTQKKYVGALCNGTSILAWARVNGKSPLEGKVVCAPTRQAAAGIYNGQRAQPSCRWHAEQNGARMSPPGSIGNPNTNVDDVSVDGLILTGEDDPSAREMGRKLAELLVAKQR